MYPRRPIWRENNGRFLRVINQQIVATHIVAAIKDSGQVKHNIGVSRMQGNTRAGQAIFDPKGICL